MKRPSFQFYPSDWLRDTSLRICSSGARGLWIDMICHMHAGEPYGHLKVGTKVILPSNLAAMVGATLPEVEGWLAELEAVGVFSKTEDGCIFSRRMIRDEDVRNKRAAGGIRGGNPALMKIERLTSKVKQNPTPSSSSPSSPSDDDVRHPLPPKFQEIETFARSSNIGIPQECIEAFFDEMESLQWTYKGNPCVVPSAWQGRFRRFSTNWNNNERGRGR
jgi:hypothetical protein